jgi:uncharacterized repeat protein (TIGR01451 family)
MPGRLGAEYVAEDNTRKTPVMLHRAIIGSMERWIGMLIENFAGAMPLWLAPVQVAVANITESQEEYVKALAETMKAAGIRVTVDTRNEKISYKITVTNDGQKDLTDVVVTDELTGDVLPVGDLKIGESMIAVKPRLLM